MQIFKKKTNWDFMGKRKSFALFSSVVVLTCLVFIFVVQPRFGIDFVGGTEIQVQFKDASATSSRIREVLSQMGFSGFEVVSLGDHPGSYLIQLKEVSTVDDEQEADLRDQLRQKLDEAELHRFEISPGGDKLTVVLGSQIDIANLEGMIQQIGLHLGTAELQAQDADQQDEMRDETSRKCESVTCTWSFRETQIYEISLTGISEQMMDRFRQEAWGKDAVQHRSEWVGAKVGRQMRNAGISSIAYALLFIMVYIAFRFDLRFAPGAVVALLHDIIVTLGIFTILRLEVTLATVASLLTIIGYSLNDTIVVFDRIRENLQISREEKISLIVNRSINQTLSRTVLTSLTTLMTVLILLILGWNTSLRDFSIALVIGVLVGTYSSVFIASPVVVWFDRFFAEKKA